MVTRRRKPSAPITMLAPSPTARMDSSHPRNIRHARLQNRETCPSKRAARSSTSLLHLSLKDRLGNVVGASTIARDITKRKQTEELARERRTLPRLRRESADAIWRYERIPISIDLAEDEQIEEFYRYGVLAECNDVRRGCTATASERDCRSAALMTCWCAPILRTKNSARLLLRLSSGRRGVVRDRQRGNAKYFLNNLVGH